MIGGRDEERRSCKDQRRLLNLAFEKPGSPPSILEYNYSFETWPPFDPRPHLACRASHAAPLTTFTPVCAGKSVPQRSWTHHRCVLNGNRCKC
eukprot:1985024-Rhodomonas_salina.2